MSLTSLSDLAADVFAGVAHALALVGLGLADATDVGRHLADGLFVDAAHDDARRCRDLERHAFGRVDHHRMTEPERQPELVRALRLGAVADPDDLQLLGEAVGQVAANIRKIRKPEPYKGKGVRYVGERVQRKAGKTGK